MKNVAHERKRDRLLHAYDGVRELPPMPVYVRYHRVPTIATLEKRGEEIIFRFTLDPLVYATKTPPGWNESEFADAFETRDAFIKITSPSEALDFFAMTGWFRSDDQPRDDYGIVKLNPTGMSLTWADLRSWQEIIRIILVDGFLRWSDANGATTLWGGLCMPNHLKVFLQRAKIPTEMFQLIRGNFSRFNIGSDYGLREESKAWEEFAVPRRAASVMVHSSLELMLMASYLDYVSGIRHRKCALADCSVIYEVQSKHDKQYCSQAHAHKASVRQRRAILSGTVKPDSLIEVREIVVDLQCSVASDYNSTMPEDKQKQLAAFDGILELMGVPSADRPKYRAGAEQLMDLGWPTNYIDAGMIDRYYKGLVPKYEGFLSFTAYQQLLREEEAAQTKARRKTSHNEM